MLFPGSGAAKRCVDFISRHAPEPVMADLELVNLELDLSKDASSSLKALRPIISAVLFSPEIFSTAKQYWQHTGDGVSSRRAEFCHDLFKEGLLIPTTVSRPDSPSDSPRKACRGPKRYQRGSSGDFGGTFQQGKEDAPKNGHSNNHANGHETQESSRFLEERFGRNLDLSHVKRAKSAISRRIAGAVAVDTDLADSIHEGLESNLRGIANLQESDIRLYPCGMNAIYNAHRYLLRARGQLKSINFGFPYVDTLKILQKFGPGCEFYGRAGCEDLDDLEERLVNGEQFLALFCEFPGNPLLTCPDLERIRQLADRYDFAVVVDETIGTFENVNVLQFADIVVSSLTKIFSGDCNVMGGSAILNPISRYYNELREAMEQEFEDTYWPEDVLFMERNSRDFGSRIARVNANAEAICEVLKASPLVKHIYYPKYNTSRPHYEACKLPDGGYGGLLSITFHDRTRAVAFYDALDTAKGPSLGTNFTLTSPYVLLAHYQELKWAAGYEVDPDLIRVSVGLESPDELRDTFRRALDAAASNCCS
jgi:cystathionine gamma-synthase